MTQSADRNVTDHDRDPSELGSRVPVTGDWGGLRRLHALHTRLARETDLHTALDEIVAAAAYATGTDRGCVQLVSDDGERLEMFVHRGHGPESGYIRHFLHAGSKPACDAARRERKRLVIDDVATFPALLNTTDREVALAHGVLACQSTPMINRRGELMGVLSTQFRHPHVPSEHELQLVDLLAWTAADFVERHHAEVALKRANAARQSFLLQLSDSVRLLHDPLEIAATAAQRLCDRLHAARVSWVEIAASQTNEAGITTHGLVLGEHALPGTCARPARRDLDVLGAAAVAALRRGEAVVVTGEPRGDAVARPATSFESGVGEPSVTVPLIRRGRLAAAVEVRDAALRAWTPMEIELIVEAAERTWDAVERARVDAALRRVEERHRRMLAIETVSVVFFDLHGGVIDANDAYLRLIGYSRAELEAGEVRYDRLTPLDWSWRDRQTIAELAECGESGPFEKQYFRRDGSRVWIHCAAKQLDERTAVEFIIDVTERKRADEALLEASRHKDEFLAMLAHELRNPLAPITNAHRLLERTQLMDDRGRSALAMAVRQTRQLQRLVDDLLEVSRVSRGKIRLQLVPMQVGDAVQHAVESVAATVEERGQALQIAIAAEIAPIRADAARLAQVLENLLNNASKFTPAGGAIRVEAEQDVDAIEIRVIDDGIGIESAKIDGLFELFHQIDATIDRSAGGLGIGLALVKQLVELHGGQVRVRSGGIGCGAVFTVRLPCMAPDSLGMADREMVPSSRAR